MTILDMILLKNKVSGNSKRRLVQTVQLIAILAFFNVAINPEAVAFFEVQWKWILGVTLLWVIILIDPSNKNAGL